MPHLHGPEKKVLALWIYGIIIARSCGLSRVAAALASNLGEKEENLRQRLREWCWAKADKKGKQRQDWQVQQSFVPLLRWILSLWVCEEKRMVLAMDATTLKQRFVVLSINVVYRGCAIPISWVVLREGEKGSWKPYWLALFSNLQGSIPSDWLVVVMADRGLYAPWLYEAITNNGWHPFLRINTGGVYRTNGTADYRPMRQSLPNPGQVWVGKVTCFRVRSVEATLLACWGEKHKEPWLILTDIDAEYARAAWYGMRCWIENFYKDIKRDGWQWQKTRMTDPERASRLWLALAIATLWVVSVGGEADASLPVSDIDLLPPTHVARRNKKNTSRHARFLSCFTRGLIELMTAFIKHFPVSVGLLYPEPWPLKTYP